MSRHDRDFGMLDPGRTRIFRLFLATEQAANEIAMPRKVCLGNFFVDTLVEIITMPMAYTKSTWSLLAHVTWFCPA